MADLSKMKGTGKKPSNRFGAPPAPEEASSTLEAPETAPAEPEVSKRKARAKTGRTVSWGTKVAPDFPKRIKRAALHADKPVNELLEIWLAEFEESEGLT